MYFWQPALALWEREVVRFLRQRNRIIGALATPMIFWLLLGSGFNPSFRVPTGGDSVSYLAYFFPGSLALIILFTAIFSTISVIEDRREGFLQGVLAAPVDPGAIVMGKLLGGTTLSILQAAVFCALGPLAGLHFGFLQILMLLAAFTLMGFSLTGLGLMLAWPMDSTQGFHAIMNVFLLPMWMLSGAMFPIPPESTVLYWISLCNPVSYGVTAIRAAFGSPADGVFSAYGIGMGVSALFCAVMYAGCSLLVTKIRKV